MTIQTTKITAKQKGKKLKIRFDQDEEGNLLVGLGGETYSFALDEIITDHDLTRASQEEEELVSEEDSNEVRAPIPGVVGRVLAEPGIEVQKGQVLLYLLAMKMENEICAPLDGIIDRVEVEEGQTVQTDDLLVVFREE